MSDLIGKELENDFKGLYTVVIPHLRRKKAGGWRRKTAEPEGDATFTHGALSN